MLVLSARPPTWGSPPSHESGAALSLPPGAAWEAAARSTGHRGTGSRPIFLSGEKRRVAVAAAVVNNRWPGNNQHREGEVKFLEGKKSFQCILSQVCIERGFGVQACKLLCGLHIVSIGNGYVTCHLQSHFQCYVALETSPRQDD